MRPSLRDLDCLSAMLDLGSAKAAADRLGLSQPAMSHALRRLRTVFGDPLFVRDGTGLRPTHRALELRASLKDVSVAMDRLVAPTAFDVATLDRTFRIAAVDYLQAILATGLSRWLPAAPGVKLGVVPLETDDNIFENGKTDIVVTLGRVASPTHRIRKLADDHYVVLVRQHHPLTQHMDVLAFAQASHVLVSPRRHGLRASVDDRLAGMGLSRNVTLAVSSFWTAACLVAESDLVTTVPSRFAACCGPFDLVALPVPIELPPMTLSMIWEEACHSDAAHHWLRQRIIDVFADN